MASPIMVFVGLSGCVETRGECRPAGKERDGAGYDTLMTPESGVEDLHESFILIGRAAGI